ncbi:MAG: TlpA family protein disulfide reductase [Deltaproteobacteria bacterium]|nr:TlpA family protein disulfide reductase [Deltaproteobacteria bacterium]
MAKLIGVLVLLGAIALLGVFAWPLLHPEDIPGGGRGAAKGPEAGASRAMRATTETVTSQPDPGTAPEVPATAATADTAAAPSGPLCDTLNDAASGRSIQLPNVPLVRRGPPVRAPAWTWVNLWAAWCKPCKEEMPLLAAWARDLRARGAAVRVVFLSLDDDERQLQRYMRGEGAGIEGDFLWTEDASARARFMNAAGLEDSPTLPVQVLIDPAGKLRCVRVGSITRKEMDEATRLFKW